MTTNLSDDISKNNNRSLWMGIILIVLGIIAIALPVVTTIFAEAWVAVILISAGFAKLFYAYNTRDRGGFVWKVLLSGLYIATGVMLFIYPRTGILTKIMGCKPRPSRTAFLDF
jgi:uncharacterized membrane protein HdeD (DUF308 family)